MSGNSIDLATEQVLIDNISSVNGNHNGGDLDIGADGYLYITTGDAGSDPGAIRARVGTTMQLRISACSTARSSDSTASPGRPPRAIRSPRSVPSAVGAVGTRRPRRAHGVRSCTHGGLRNPFRFAFDPNTSSTRFFINDVGQSTREEVDDGVLGANYGWNSREGQCPRGQNPPCAGPPAGVTDPITDYPRSIGTFITAGAFVPGGRWPIEFEGGYLFARRWIRKRVAADVDRRCRLRQPGSHRCVRPHRHGLRRRAGWHVALLHPQWFVRRSASSDRVVRCPVARRWRCR